MRFPLPRPHPNRPRRRPASGVWRLIETEAYWNRFAQNVFNAQTYGHGPADPTGQYLTVTTQQMIAIKNDAWCDENIRDGECHCLLEASRISYSVRHGSAREFIDRAQQMTQNSEYGQYVYHVGRLLLPRA